MAKGREKPAKRGRKKSRKKIAAGALAGVLVMGGIGAGVYAKVNQKGNAPQEIKTAQSASAQLGSISNTIVGTGNLELQEAEALTVPSGIKIQEVLVESGDVITKGETLATVDEASVLKAVEETQEEIKELDEQISECQEDEDEDCIETAVAGRVKLIYTAAGDEVTDVMLEHGALMVLSLDGKMAVDLTGISDAEEGGTVSVTLSSGTEVTGTVVSVSGNSYTVTVTDNGTLYGDTVTVTNSDGTLAGEGTLYIHQPLEITGTVGTVESVDVSENESVSAGAQLLTLEGTASQSQYQELLAEREARSQTLKKLLLLTKDQKITAQAGGTIQSVNIAASSSASSADSSASGSSSGTAASAVSGTAASAVSGTVSSASSRTAASASSGAKVSQMSYTSGRSTATMVSLSFTDGCGETAQQDIQEVINDPQAAEYVSETGRVMETAASQTLMLMVYGSGECTASGLAVEAPAAGNTPVTEVAASDGSYTGAVTWNPADTVFAGSADYQALVVLRAGEGYQFNSDSIQGADVGTISGISVSQDGKTLEFQISYPRTGSSGGDVSGDDSGHNSGDEPGQDVEGGGQNGGGEGESGFTGGDNSGESGNGEGNSGQGGSGNGSSGISGSGGNDGSSENGSSGQDSSGSGSSGQDSSGSGSLGQGSSGTSQSGTGQSSGTQSGSGTPSSSGTQSGSGTQSSSTQSESGTAAEDGEKTSSEISASAYSTDVTAFTVSPDDYMQLSVNVDELDINSVEKGQKAVVTFDAIEDEEFEGEVTGIGNTASVNGGVAKYTVSLTIPKDDRMREGMNASATITIESKENVITLPMTALQEQGSRVFVYTQQSEDGTLSGEQEVSTGLSDGSTVEITEGLSEGDTVYYNRTGNIQGGSSGQSSGFGDMGGFGGGMGDFGGDSTSRPDRSSGSSGGMGGGNPGQGGGTPPGM